VSQFLSNATNQFIVCSACGGRGGNTEPEAVGRVEGAR
jgi:hypothetical protein